jgi:hypothetical protein
VSALDLATVAPLPAGAKGFDTTAALDAATVAAFRKRGYDFVVRYIRRDKGHIYDLTAAEVETILAGDLALSVVQYVESANSWTPSQEKGAQFGKTAADSCKAIGLPNGMTVWCDLEGVALGVDAKIVVGYCRAWYLQLANAGYAPGLYIGWHSVLSGPDFYRELPFTRYWAAYNADGDQSPQPRGFCMRQHAMATADVPSGISLPPDTDLDLVVPDALGGLPFALTPQRTIV